MKKILIIIPCVPYPLTSGGNQAFFNMVDYIRHEMSVSVLVYAWTNEEEKKVEDLKRLWQNVDFYVFAKEKEAKFTQPLVRNPFYYKWLKKLKSSIERKMRRQLSLPKRCVSDILNNEDFAHENSVLSDSVFKELGAQYIDYVVEIANLGFDIIQVEFYELIALGYILPQNVQTIFVHHELRYIRNKNEMALFKEVLSVDSIRFLVAKDFERDALRKYRHVITLTEVDRRLLVELMGREDRIYASPAVVRFKTDFDNEFISCICNRFTFVGYGGHFPNLDAVVWFCKEVAPLFRKCGLKFTFQVVGMGYEQHSKELQLVCPEIELVGFVEKLEPFLQGSIALVPIRIGSGMRMKILDMVSSNVPFITTSKGLEGIHLSHAKECLIADSASDFAEAMVRLSGDFDLQEKIVGQAKVKLKELYNPQEMLERRLSVYTSILKD